MPKHNRNQRVTEVYSSRDYFAMFKEHMHLDSDYRTAQYLNVSRQLMTKIKNGQPLSSEMAFKMAKAMKRDPLELIATSMAEKERDSDLKAMWIKLAKEKGNDG